MNAVIVDIKGKYAAALDENGSIVKIRNANYMIGQRIALHELHQKRAPSMKKTGVVAAAAALILSVGTVSAYATPYGTVSLDSDSSIEYTINRFDRVLRVKALNEEGETVLASLDEKSLRFRPVEDVIVVTLEKMDTAVQNTDTDNLPPVQITAVTKNEQHTARLQEHLMQSIPPEMPSMRPAEHTTIPNNTPAVDLQDAPFDHSNDSFADSSPFAPDNGQTHPDDPSSGRMERPQEQEAEPVPEKEITGEEPADDMRSDLPDHLSSDFQPSSGAEMPPRQGAIGGASPSSSFEAPSHGGPPPA